MKNNHVENVIKAIVKKYNYEFRLWGNGGFKIYKTRNSWRGIEIDSWIYDELYCFIEDGIEHEKFRSIAEIYHLFKNADKIRFAMFTIPNPHKDFIDEQLLIEADLES